MPPACPPFLLQKSTLRFTKLCSEGSGGGGRRDPHVTHTTKGWDNAHPCSPRPVAKENGEADVPQGGNTLPSRQRHHPNRPSPEQPSVADTGCSSGSHLGTAARRQRGVGVGIEIL